MNAVYIVDYLQRDLRREDLQRDLRREDIKNRRNKVSSVTVSSYLCSYFVQIVNSIASCLTQ